MGVEQSKLAKQETWQHARMCVCNLWGWVILHSSEISNLASKIVYKRKEMEKDVNLFLNILVLITTRWNGNSSGIMIESLLLGDD